MKIDITKEELKEIIKEVVKELQAQPQHVPYPYYVPYYPQPAPLYRTTPDKTDWIGTVPNMGIDAGGTWTTTIRKGTLS